MILGRQFGQKGRPVFNLGAVRPSGSHCADRLYLAVGPEDKEGFLSPGKDIQPRCRIQRQPSMTSLQERSRPTPKTRDAGCSGPSQNIADGLAENFCVSDDIRTKRLKKNAGPETAEVGRSHVKVPDAMESQASEG